MRAYRILFILFIGIVPVSASAGAIEKGFEALKEFNYFEAKRQFYKALKKEPSAASFGLATIYYRSDNPFHNLDSAYNTIVRSEMSYNATPAKTKERLAVYGFNYQEIENLREAISHRFFMDVKELLTENALDKFQSRHPWSKDRAAAIHLRDSVAYFAAVQQNTSAGFSEFSRKYPDSEYAAHASAEFSRLQYNEKIQPGNITSYMAFIRDFPQSPYNARAQDEIYAIATQKNSIDAYRNFIRTYPNNRNVEDAWRKVYQLYIYDYSADRVREFMKEYPDYPFQKELDRDIELAGTDLIPFKKGAFFGWMTVKGKEIVPATYESVGLFHEGLAWAEKNGKYGYVNKDNEIVIPFAYTDAMDFEKGRAIVSKDELYGIIDRAGVIIFEPVYKDIGQFSEGLIYAQKDSLYGYFDVYGFERIPPKFSEAFSFSGGIAKIQTTSGLQAYIDIYGSFVVPPIYEEIEFFTDTLLVFADGDFYGLMNRKGKTIVPAVYDEIAQLSCERAVFVKRDLIGYFNPAGVEVIPAQFENVPNGTTLSSFQRNIAVVKSKNGKFGIIDRSGKPVVPFTYQQLGRTGDLIAFESKGKWGYINAGNKVVVPPAFEFAESFVNGLGEVKLLTLSGMVDKTGKFVIPANYAELNFIDEKHILASTGSRYGVFSAEGKLLVPVEYAQIRKVNDDLLVLTRSGSVDYLYLRTEEIIQSPAE